VIWRIRVVRFAIKYLGRQILWDTCHHLEEISRSAIPQEEDLNDRGEGSNCNVSMNAAEPGGSASRRTYLPMWRNLKGKAHQGYQIPSKMLDRKGFVHGSMLKDEDFSKQKSATHERRQFMRAC
jgi:hypothetical protein